MKDINKLQPKQAIVLKGKEEVITLIKNESIVTLKTDNTDHEPIYTGVVTFINKDGISVDDGDIIFWEYIVELELL